MLDGTTSGELQPRSFERTPRRAALRLIEDEAPAAVAVARAHDFVSVQMPSNGGFYKLMRSAFVPYGLVSAAHMRQVYEVYWYSGDCYGVPMSKLYKLDDAALAASVAPKAGELRALRPLLAAQHPLRPYATPAGRAEPAPFVKKFVDMALEAGVPASAEEPPPAEDAWVAPHRTATVLAADARQVCFWAAHV